MAALAAALDLPTLGTPTKAYVRAGVVGPWYGGGLVFGLAAGGATNVPAAGTSFLGILTRNFGTVTVGDLLEIYVDGVFKFPTLASITTADEGDIIIQDISAATLTDNVADLIGGTDATLAAGDILIGQILAVVSDGHWVQLKQTSGVANVLGFAGA